MSGGLRQGNACRGRVRQGEGAKAQGVSAWALEGSRPSTSFSWLGKLSLGGVRHGEVR